MDSPHVACRVSGDRNHPATFAVTGRAERDAQRVVNFPFANLKPRAADEQSIPPRTRAVHEFAVLDSTQAISLVSARPQLGDRCIGADIGRTAIDAHGNAIICDNYLWRLNRGERPRHPVG
ncbi:hypothetical protein ACPXCG_17780 [Gordonia sp. DT218]|uniref:hypothetical protein n=1 Tax=Gordonia sp. DT218 TaxID=3416659 RepID=UPI003CFB6180